MNTHSEHRALAALTAAIFVATASPAFSAADARQIFGDFFQDMGWLAAAAIGVAALVAILRSLRNQGVLSDRWRFGDECDQD